MLEELKQFADKLKEKQQAYEAAGKDLEAYNKSFTAWISSKVGLPENSQLHLAELMTLVAEKLK